MKQFFYKLKEYSLPILLFLGVTILIVYYLFKYFAESVYLEHLNGFKELLSIGLTICGSGIFLAVLKWFQFMGFFREELRGIINSSDFEDKLENTVYNVLYSDDFLKKQHNLTALWSKVNRCLFNHEFPEPIAAKIERKVEELFFHQRTISHYYKNNVYTIDVNLDDVGNLQVIEQAEAKIVRPSKEKFMVDYNYFVKKSKVKNIASITFNEVKIDGHAIGFNEQIIADTATDLQKKIEISLSDQYEYNIASKITLMYNIDDDFEYEYFSERFIDYLRVSVNHPSNLRVIFSPIGNDKFEDGPASGYNFVKTFNDIMLPERGFRLIFVKN